MGDQSLTVKIDLNIMQSNLKERFSSSVNLTNVADNAYRMKQANTFSINAAR
jgi:hypothetical protein